MPDPKRPRDKWTTQRGYSVSTDFDVDTPTIPNAATVITPPRAPEPQPEVPAVEVQVVTEQGPMSASKGPWRAIEIWTKNRIYSVDSTMLCFEVIDRSTGRADTSHGFVGARLGGGQRREGTQLRLSHPYPVPGTEAVFKLPAGSRGRFGQTSKVERVVLRLRVATVALLDAEPLWEDITGRWSVHPRGNR